jgi:porin
MRLNVLLSYVVFLIFLPVLSLASDDDLLEVKGREFRAGFNELPQFGGPSSVAGELKAADAIKEPAFRFDDIQRGLAPWFAWKEKTFNTLNLALGIEVNFLYQYATASLGEDRAAGAMYRFPGEWLAYGRGSENTGSLVFRFEYRDKHFTDIAPAQLGTEIGTASLTPGFAYAEGFGPNVTELYWKQLFNNKRFGFVAGILDFSPYFDYYPFTSLGKGFISREFLLNPTLATTGVGALGAAARGFVTDHIWLGGAFYDANAVNGEWNIDTWNREELLKHAEIGWTPSIERTRIDRVQLTYWHVDERSDANVPEGSGLALSISSELADRFLPFLRIGISDGGGGAPAEEHYFRQRTRCGVPFRNILSIPDVSDRFIAT